jgi:hypothetical protein
MDRLELSETANLTTRQRQAFELIKLKGHKLEAQKEYHDRIRKLEERISKLEQDFLRHIFEEHIIERFLRT